MQERTKRIRLAKKRHRHELTKKRRRKGRLAESREELRKQRFWRYEGGQRKGRIKRK